MYWLLERGHPRHGASKFRRLGILGMGVIMRGQQRDN